MTRNEVDRAYTWDLTAIYPSEAAWEAEFSAAQAAVGTLGELPGTLGASPAALKQGLDRVYRVMEQVDRLYRYAELKKSEDNGDPAAQRMAGRAMKLYVEMSAGMSFVDPEILAIPEKTLEAWTADPALAEYRHILEDTARMRAHTLPEAQEKLLSTLQDAASAPSEAFTMLENVDLRFPEVTDETGEKRTLTHGNFMRFRESKSRAVRREAFQVYHGEFRNYINTFAALYAGQVKQDCWLASVRGYGSALEKSLFGGNVPVAVYDSLVEAVRRGLPLMERYLRLRQRLLGLDRLEMYDLYCPMVDAAEYPVDLESAKAMVKAATAPLGAEYGRLLDMAYRERWMDVYENQGKTTGAFSMGVHGVHPYVLLNFTDSLQDVFTMAHELGHAMHSWLSSKHNSYPNHNYRILVAEVASTVNEVLLTRHLLRTETDGKRRAHLLNHLLESFRTTVFRQTLFAEFEREAHRLYESGEPLTAELLCGVYHRLNEDYYPGVRVDEYQDVEWARVPHFYSAYYVYQYATGFCSAVAIADRILETGDPSDYLRFLTTGGSDYPLEELKIAGVDLTKPEVVDRALQVFAATLEELEAQV